MASLTKQKKTIRRRKVQKRRVQRQKNIVKKLRKEAAKPGAVVVA
jgi:hypothetical protein